MFDILSYILNLEDHGNNEHLSILDKLSFSISSNEQKKDDD